MTRRGQVTIFLILGILILGSMFFLYSYSTKLNDQSIKKNKNAAMDIDKLKRQISVEMQSCFDEAVRDGVDLLGENGGYIPKEFNHETKYNHKINITGNIEKNPSNYLMGRDDSYILYFKNHDKFLSVCKHLPEVTFLKDEDYGCTKQLSDFFSISCNNSVQNRLEEVVLSFFESCIINTTQDIPGFTLEHEDVRKMEIVSVFAPNAIEFFLDGDLIMRSEKSNEVITLPGINSFIYPIGLKSFYSREFKDALEKECLDETYDFKENLIQLFLNGVFQDATYDSYLVSERIFDGKLYDIINFKLDASFTDTGYSGNYFYFTFARENREPVLTNPFMNQTHVKFTVYDPDEDLMDLILIKGNEQKVILENITSGEYTYKPSSEVDADGFKITDGHLDVVYSKSS
ncbi:hypothetical protein KY334_06475 [Candidatus Woesearchaeota archaeon]|nr:hypothetical protein [Candidatus Woesearchaeota archaeon]